MAEKQSSKERMREGVDSIETGIKALFESDKYRKYLATMSRFHRYSLNNVMLIHNQMQFVIFTIPRLCICNPGTIVLRTGK